MVYRDLLELARTLQFNSTPYIHDDTQAASTPTILQMLWQLWVLGSTRAATSGAQREQRGRRQGDARVRASCTRRRLVRRTSTPAASAEQRTATNAVCKQHVEVNVAVQVRRRDRATHGARAAAVGDAEVAMVEAKVAVRVAEAKAAVKAGRRGWRRGWRRQWRWQ